ncbi:MAG: OmpA family protein [Candidatus Hydrogenedentes bacterium]|nr:OmpA family protein [Candidatus Hydrogenedentota bacterium]
MFDCGCAHPARTCGYWWWPTEPASNEGDMELWGNRGIIYHCWEQPAPVVEPPVAPPTKPERTKVLLNNVLFDFDKAVLKPEGKAEVDKLVAEMKAHPGDSVVIQGHTCDIGTEEYNMGLGQRRADAVKRYMIEQGIDQGRVTTVSFGETQPAVPNTDAANRKLNRRAQFDVTLSDQ